MGYVGLTLAATLGEIGLQVTGIERNPTTVDQLCKGSSHIHEAGLQPLIKRLVEQGNLGSFEFRVGYAACGLIRVK